jgi:hypothetical protein
MSSKDRPTDQVVQAAIKELEQELAKEALDSYGNNPDLTGFTRREDSNNNLEKK